LSIFRKSEGKIEVTLTSEKNNGYFAWRPKYVSYYILLICS